MLDRLNREVFEDGSLIFQEGEPGDSAYLIESGEVEILARQHGQEQRISLIGKGELFGEVALIDHQPRTATARARGRVVLIPIARQLVNELLQKTDPIVRHLLLVVLERFRGKRAPELIPAPQQASDLQLRSALRGEATQKLTLANDVARALEKDEFELYYQPLCELASGSIAGFEALIRWQHPLQGLMSPHDFLWLAEQTGQIRELGLWTLRRACRDWPALRPHTRHPHPFVSVNLSPAQLTSSHFVENVKAILAEQAMPPGELKLELTETVMVEKPELALELLRQLTALGSSLALDDYGTGHSGLDNLRRFPIGTMKIDRAFISRLLESGPSREIVRSSINLAHTLGMDVVAEGVESQKLHEALRELGCDYGQGWLYGKPLPLSQLGKAE